MTDHKLATEWATLLAERDELRAEHTALEQRPNDLLARRAHIARLQAHAKRLRDYVAARQIAVLEKWSSY